MSGCRSSRVLLPTQCQLCWSVLVGVCSVQRVGRVCIKWWLFPCSKNLIPAPRMGPGGLC